MFLIFVIRIYCVFRSILNISNLIHIGPFPNILGINIYLQLVLKEIQPLK